MKTNRIIYPKGIGIQIKNFAQYIEKNDVHLVTVNNSKYWVYRYEGHLNGVDNAVVLLCWQKSAFKKTLGLNTYQVRSSKSIDRLLSLIALTYIYCSTIENADDSFSKGISVCRNNTKKDNIQWIYECAKSNTPIEVIFKVMNLK